MELTERKKKILRAIVEQYIRTAEPVCSKAVCELPELKVSSATVRNEMAYLTEMGYLEQPHTSAGRIPSPAGYRLYIDELMQDYRITGEEAQSMTAAFDEKMRQFDNVIAQASKIVSKMTNLPAYAVTQRSRRCTIKKFEVLSAGEGSFILLLMTDQDVVKNKLLRLPVLCGEGELKLLSAVLNASATGLTVEELTPDLLDRISRSVGPAEPLVPVILEYTGQLLREQEQGEVFLSGQTRLLGQPEFRDPAKAQELLTQLDEEMISGLPAAIQPDSKMKILVGPENVARELKDTSVVMTRFDIGDGMQGMIGVVGPTRMDYAQITARLSYFTESLSRMFQKPDKPELPASPENTQPSPKE